MLTVIEKVLFLQTVDLLSELTTEQLSFLAMIAEEIAVPEGTRIYGRDDPPDGLYVVISGSVKMLRGDDEIDRVKANGAFGVWALFDDEPRLLTAAAMEPSLLLFIGRDDFYEVLADHVDLVEGLFRQLVKRLRRLAGAVRDGL